MRPDTPRVSQGGKSGRILPFFIDFIKFSTGFAAIIALGLFSLHIANAAM